MAATGGASRQRFLRKSVLITGAATGIGRATTRAFAAEGAGLVLGDVDERTADLADEIIAMGREAHFMSCDVTRDADVEALVSFCVSRFGRVDAAFNNAGILPPPVRLHEIDPDDFHRIIAVDVKGVFTALRAELAQMLKQGGGAIVNTASVAGVIEDPCMGAYVAAKHAVIGLTKAAALEYARDNIRVNAIAPGLVATPMTARWLADPAFREAFFAASPIGRAAEPEEIAGTVLHLCSDDASFTNGQIAIIDGGQTVH